MRIWQEVGRASTSLGRINSLQAHYLHLILCSPHLEELRIIFSGKGERGRLSSGFHILWEREPEAAQRQDDERVFGIKVLYLTEDDCLHPHAKPAAEKLRAFVEKHSQAFS